MLVQGKQRQNPLPQGSRPLNRLSPEGAVVAKTGAVQPEPDL